VIGLNIPLFSFSFLRVIASFARGTTTDRLQVENEAAALISCSSYSHLFKSLIIIIEKQFSKEFPRCNLCDRASIDCRCRERERGGGDSVEGYARRSRLKTTVITVGPRQLITVGPRRL